MQISIHALIVSVSGEIYPCKVIGICEALEASRRGIVLVVKGLSACRLKAHACNTFSPKCDRPSALLSWLIHNSGNRASGIGRKGPQANVVISLL